MLNEAITKLEERLKTVNSEFTEMLELQHKYKNSNIIKSLVENIGKELEVIEERLDILYYLQESK